EQGRHRKPGIQSAAGASCGRGGRKDRAVGVLRTRGTAPEGADAWSSRSQTGGAPASAGWCGGSSGRFHRPAARSSARLKRNASAVWATHHTLGLFTSVDDDGV